MIVANLRQCEEPLVINYKGEPAVLIRVKESERDKLCHCPVCGKPMIRDGRYHRKVVGFCDKDLDRLPIQFNDPRQEVWILTDRFACNNPECRLYNQHHNTNKDHATTHVVCITDFMMPNHTHSRQAVNDASLIYQADKLLKSGELTDEAQAEVDAAVATIEKRYTDYTGSSLTYHDFKEAFVNHGHGRDSLEARKKVLGRLDRMTCASSAASINRAHDNKKDAAALFPRLPRKKNHYLDLRRLLALLLHFFRKAPTLYRLIDPYISFKVDITIEGWFKNLKFMRITNGQSP